MITWGRLDEAVTTDWAELIAILAHTDGTDEFYEAEDLAEELTETGFDPELDSWAVWDDDRLIAFGQLRVSLAPQHDDATIRCQLDGGVHPQYRGQGIGRDLLARMEQRAAELTQQRHPGLPFHLRASGGRVGSSASALLARAGYRTVRWFTSMERALPGDPAPEVDAERLVSPTEADEEAVRVAHNEAFVDHFGSSPFTSQRWHDVYASRVARPQFSSIVMDAQGRVLAYALTQQYVDGSLYVALVGTVPAARGRGLARSVLARTIELARADASYSEISLEVDSQSPTGADRLYTSLGFRPARSLAAMRKDP